MASLSPRHIPVLVEEVLGILRPDMPGVWVDGTLGLGGHAEALLRHGHPGVQLFGFDRDAESLALAEDRLSPWSGRVTLVHQDFRDGAAFLKKAASSAPSGGGCSISASAPSTSMKGTGDSPSCKRARLI